MFLNKKNIKLLVLILAIPLDSAAFTVKITTKSLTKDAKIAGVAIGIAVVGYGIYVKLRGPKQFKDYMDGANAQAEKTLQSRADYIKNSNSKVDIKKIASTDTSGCSQDEIRALKKYKILTLEQIRESREAGFSKYVADQTANELGIKPEEFSTYLGNVVLDGVQPSTIVNRLYKVQAIVDTMIADPLKVAALQGASKLAPFKAALKKAIHENITSQQEAVEAMNKLATADASLLSPSEQSLGARLGESAAQGALGAADRVSELGTGAGRALVRGAAVVGENVSDFAKAGYQVARPVPSGNQSGSVFNDLEKATTAATVGEASLVASAPQVSMQRVQQLRAGMTSAQASQSAASNMAKELEARQATAQVNADDKVDPTVDTPEVF